MTKKCPCEYRNKLSFFYNPFYCFWILYINLYSFLKLNKLKRAPLFSGLHIGHLCTFVCDPPHGTEYTDDWNQMEVNKEMSYISHCL